MPPVLRSLATVTTGHTVFEPNQVLTDTQLNSVADYADDQIRLTRVRLLGVGIACGLEVAAAGGRVTVTRGIGVTTDGDLLALDADTAFDRYRPYDRTSPAYPPLYVGGDVQGTMVPAFELVPVGAADDRARPLADLATRERLALDAATALLLMESYVKDDDLCSGTDCDNLGREAVHTPKLLVVDRDAAGPLRERVATAAEAFGGLPPVVVTRPAIDAAIADAAALAERYAGVCDEARAQLATALPEIHRRCAAFLGDVVDEGSAARWLQRIDAHAARLDAGAGMQYYYDFLKDVVDTYEALRERHVDDTAVCAPPADGFAKHLLLGDLAPGADASSNRTGFYPSPLAAGRGEDDHARFLVAKLEALVAGFAIPAARGPVRVTPSAFEDRPLEERAIPFYYEPRAAAPPFRTWSWPLRRRGAEAASYSYHAATYAKRGSAAAEPLGAQIGRFRFFRVEGHVGLPAAAARDAIEALITSHNLPFCVRIVLLGRDRGRVVRPRKPRVTDLHHVHQILRKDIATRLGEVRDFSVELRGQVASALTQKVISGVATENEGVAAQEVALRNGDDVERTAGSAIGRLGLSYTAYQASPTAWRADLGTTLAAAGRFKSEMSPVARTEFNTPFDTLIASTHVDWLPWLDDIIKAKDEKADEKLTFARFAARHPALEHFGGVERGGTLVLLHDAGGTVVADLALPYYAPEEDDELVEPALTDPAVRPGTVTKGGLRITPARTSAIEKTFDSQFTSRIGGTLDTFKQSYVKLFEGSIGVIRPQTADLGSAADVVLEGIATRLDLATAELDQLRTESQRPDLPDTERTAVRERYERKAQEVAGYVQTATELAVTTGRDPAAGTTTGRVLDKAGTALQAIGGTRVEGATKAAVLGAAGRVATNPALHGKLTSIAR